MIPAPSLPNDGRPVVVLAHASRQNRLHHVRLLISAGMASEVKVILRFLDGAGSAYSLCNPSTVAILSVAPMRLFAILGRLT